MTRIDAIRPTGAALLVGAVIGLLTVTGCGSGQIAQTANDASVVTGAAVNVGDIAVRDAEIEFPSGGGPAGAAYRTGGTAPVSMTIINESDGIDRLVSASSPVAGSVRIDGDTSLPGHHVLVTGSRPGAGQPDTTQVRLALTSLTQDIRPGLNYPLMLTFQRAGTVTVNLPVGIAAGERVAEGGQG